MKTKLSDVLWEVVKEEVAACIAVPKAAGKQQRQQQQLRTRATRVAHRACLGGTVTPVAAVPLIKALQEADVGAVLAQRLARSLLPTLLSVSVLFPAISPGSVPSTVTDATSRRRYHIASFPLRYIPAFAHILQLASEHGDAKTCGVTRLVPGLGSLIPGHVSYDMWSLIDLFRPRSEWADDRLPRHRVPAACLPGRVSDWSNSSVGKCSGAAREVVFHCLFDSTVRGIWPTAAAQRQGMRIGDSVSSNGFTLNVLHTDRSYHTHEEMHHRFRAVRCGVEAYVEGTSESNSSLAAAPALAVTLALTPCSPSRCFGTLLADLSREETLELAGRRLVCVDPNAGSASLFPGPAVAAVACCCCLLLLLLLLLLL